VRLFGQLAVVVLLAMPVMPPSLALVGSEPGDRCAEKGQQLTTASGTLECRRTWFRGLRWRVVESQPTTTTTKKALSCASGGACRLGDTGPGGGIVFYVGSSTFASLGSDCATACRYLEAAPSPRRWLGDVDLAWTPSLKSRTTGAVGTSIGSGYQNTARLFNQYVQEDAPLAATYALRYSNRGKTDWHLPSRDELVELFLRSDLVGDLSYDVYWSSTEDDYWRAINMDFTKYRNESGTSWSSYKWNEYLVRPVRAF